MSIWRFCGSGCRCSRPSFDAGPSSGPLVSLFEDKDPAACTRPMRPLAAGTWEVRADAGDSCLNYRHLSSKKLRGQDLSGLVRLLPKEDCGKTDVMTATCSYCC